MKAKYFLKSTQVPVALLLNGLSSWKKLLKAAFLNQLLGSVIKHDDAPRSELSYDFESCGEITLFTFRAHEGCLHRLASITTPCLIKWKALLSCSAYYLSIFGQVFHTHERLGPINPACVCVGNVQISRHGVSCEVVSVSWVVAVKWNYTLHRL